MRSLIVARTTAGAESAARLVIDDSLSIVADLLDDATRERIVTYGADVFIIECDTRQVQWLKVAMETVVRAAVPASRILLVLAPGSDDGIEESVVDGLRGWVIDGATAMGEVVALHATRTNKDANATTIVESLRGAQQIAAMLRFVAHPSDNDLPEFEYESSLAMSYLAQVPRLKSDIRTLEQQVADARKDLQSRGSRAPRPATTRAGGFADDASRSSDRTHSNDAQPSGLARQWKLGIAALAATLAIVAAWAVAYWLDAGIVGFLTVIAVAAVGGLAIDVRRRFIGLNRGVRQNAASLQRQLRLEQSTSSKVDGISKAMATSADLAAVAAVAQTHDERTKRQAETTLTRVAEAVDRMDRLAVSTDAGFSSLHNSIASKGDVARLVRAELLIAYNQIESNIRLRDVVDVTGFTPPMRGWAASPDVIALLVDEMRRTRPRLVVECGSGASTAWLAMAARSMGLDTRIIALEHDPVFAAATSQLLDDCGVDDIAEVRLAPLREITLGDFVGPWYETKALEDLEDICLVFVDGPPGSVGELSRYPALPVMSSKLSANATVVLDDLVRDEEKRTAERWQAEFPDAEQTVVSVEKGAAVLRFSSDG